MASKKEIDKIFFRLDWWQYLRWQSPELIAEVMTRFMNHCSGQAQLDINEGTKPQNAVETFLFPMILQFERDKASYDEACRQNAANINKRWNKKKNETQEEAPEETQEEVTADTTEYDQENRNTTEYDRIRPNTTEYDQENRNTKKGKERKGKEKNIFFFSADEETSPDEKKEKKEILRELAFYFLEKAVLHPCTEAEKAWNYNEAQGWKSVNKNGSVKDYSSNKLAFLKGWQCEGLRYSQEDGAVFADICREVDIGDKTAIDAFCGCFHEGNTLVCRFTHQKGIDAFRNEFRDEKGQWIMQKTDAAIDCIARHKNFENINGLKFRVEEKR